MNYFLKNKKQDGNFWYLQRNVGSLFASLCPAQIFNQPYFLNLYKEISQTKMAKQFPLAVKANHLIVLLQKPISCLPLASSLSASLSPPFIVAKLLEFYL